MPRQGATERSTAGRSPEISAPQLVGREREMAALTSALAGRITVVLVEGEAGIGKTRLVQEYLATQGARQSRALVACCPPFRQPHTLGPVVDALRGAAPDGVRGGRLSGLAGALRPLFPEWADHLPPPPEPAEDATAARHRVFRALDQLLDRLAVRVLVAEDAHWADEGTLEFLLYLASRQPQKVSLVVTFRPEDVPEGSLLPRLSRWAAGGYGLLLALGPLDVTGTARLACSMLSGERVSDQFAALIHERTDGVPLAVEESIRLLADRGDVVRRDGQWVRRHLQDLDVPPTVRDAVLERAIRLDPDAQAVVRATAVLADPADEATVAAVAGLDAEQAMASLSVALRCRLLAEDNRGLVSFRHTLAGQAVYESMAAPDRRLLHLRAGQAMEQASPLPVAQLARHFREAGQADKWSRYAEQAADLALASGDEPTAALLLHDLVTGLPLTPGQAARLVRKIPLGALAGRARYEGLVQGLRSALNSGGLGTHQEADLRVQLGQVMLTMEDNDAGRAELEAAIPHLGHDPAQAARAMLLLGWPENSTWPASVHLRWLQRAADLTPQVLTADQRRLVVDRATGLLLLGEPEGWDVAAQIPGDAESSTQPQELTRGHLNIGHMAMLWGRYQEATRRLEIALELASRHEYQRYRDMVLVTRAHLDWFTGAWDGLADRTAALARDEDLQPVTRLDAMLVNGLAHAARGDRATAEQLLCAVVEETRQRNTVQWMEPAAALARLQLASGRIAEALKITAAPATVVADKGTWIWATELCIARTGALVASGRVGEAEELTAAFARGLRGRNASAAQAGLATCRAILAGARGQHARAASLFANAARRWQALPRPYDALLAREQQACCLLAAEREEAGLAVATEVWQGLATLGATADAERMRRTLRSRGVQAWDGWRGGRRGYGDRLSPRELDVIRLVGAGRSTREIAQELCRSPGTVYTQLRSAMRKLDVTSRTALALRAAEIGLASWPDSQESSTLS